MGIRLLGLVCAAASLLACGSGAIADVTTLTFDDIPSTTANYPTVPDGYGGLNWSEFDVIPGVIVDGRGVTGDHAAINRNALVATVAEDVTFDFIGADLTSAWQDDNYIAIEGFLDGSPVAAAFAALFTNSTHSVDYNFVGIDELRFTTYGGTPNASLPGTGSHFIMDNLRVNVVPAPAAIALGGLGLGLVGWLRKRRTA